MIFIAGRIWIRAIGASFPLCLYIMMAEYTLATSHYNALFLTNRIRGLPRLWPLAIYTVPIEDITELYFFNIPIYRLWEEYDDIIGILGAGIYAM